MSVMNELELKANQVYDELSHVLSSDKSRRERNKMKPMEITYIHTNATAKLFALALSEISDESLREDIIKHFRYILNVALEATTEDSNENRELTDSSP